MKIVFDCSKDCKHMGICKYVDGMNKLDNSLKAINPEGHDHLIIHVKCRHYVGTWGGVTRDGE